MKNNNLALLLEPTILFNNNKEFTFQASPNPSRSEWVNKVNYYCEWLDKLKVNSVMVFSSPSIDILCLCYALVLKNKTYIPIHTSTASELLTRYLSDFSVDLLIVGEELTEHLDSKFKKKLTKEEQSTWLYYSTKSASHPFCWLPGIVFFTSGSTDLPKVVHYHYNVIAKYLTWCLQEFKLTEQDHFLFTTELSFIASLRPLFIPLLANARLSFLGVEANKIGLILEHLSQSKITVLNITPSLFKVLVDHIKHQGLQEKLSNLRLILLSGEPLDDVTINYWFKQINFSTVFYNLYGATEFLVPFYKRITSLLHEDERLHLGQLRTGCDYKLEFIKERGYELSVAGDLATGYFDAIKTQETYFWRDGKQFIKTNDCVRLIQGKLFYYTRNQRIVKRYGQIINLDQIEYLVKKNYPQCNFVTLANEDQKNEIYLFIENQNDESLLAALKLMLKQHLPNYMHPSKYHFIKEFPRTKSGKVAYSLLKKMATPEKANQCQDFFKKFFPNQEVDNTAAIMDLGLESIDYIELSLLFLKETGKWLDVSQINDATSIADLVSYLIPVTFEKSKPKLAVRLNPLLELFFRSPRKKEICLMSTFCLDDKMDLNLLEKAIRETIEQHFMLSCKLVHLKDNYYFEPIEPQQVFKLKTPSIFRKKVKIEVFTYSERLVLIHLQKKNNKLFLIIAYNHIALDGWSALLLREEIFLRYEGHEKINLPRAQEIEALNKLNEIWLPPTENSIVELKREFIDLNPPDYHNTACLYDATLVKNNACFYISKEKMEQFMSRNRLINIPYSVLFALVLNEAVIQLINTKKLMFYVSFSDRNLPLEHIKELFVNLATTLPIFLDSENKSLLTRAQHLQKIFTIYFKNMSYAGVSKIWNEEIIDRKSLTFMAEPYPIIYTYINKIMQEDYVQNKYIDWNNSLNEVQYGKDVGIFLRVYNLGAKVVVILNTTMNKGLHQKLLAYINKVFNL